MSKIDYQALRERYSPKPVPECSVCGEEMSIQRISGAHVVYACSSYGGDGDFKIGRTLADEHYEKSRVTVVDDSDPDVIALLDELEAAKSKLNEQREYYEGVISDGSKRIAELEARERNQQYIKSRDQENEDIALTVGKLLIENGRLVADTLRQLADNEIDSDYFAITSTNENGTEIDHEMAITDYALQAAGTVDELVAALESAAKRIAELEAREILLPERSSMLHRTDFNEDYQTVMAYKVSEVIAAIRVAGIRIKGE